MIGGGPKRPWWFSLCLHRRDACDTGLIAPRYKSVIGIKWLEVKFCLEFGSGEGSTIKRIPKVVAGSG